MRKRISSLLKYLASSGFYAYGKSLSENIVQSLKVDVHSQGRFYVVEFSISVNNIVKKHNFIMPSDRIFTFIGKQYVSPLIFIPHKDDWQKGKIDWKKGRYIPAYLLYMIGQLLKYLEKDDTTIALMPTSETFFFKMEFEGDKTFNTTKFPVWYDITHQNSIGKKSYEEMVILPLFSEHDVSTYREYRAVSPSQKGIICPVHTPESKKIGFQVFMARGSKYNKDNFTLSYGKGSTEDMFSTAVLHVPYVNYSDAPRVMMGAKNYRQAVLVKGAEKPIIATGYEEEFLGVNALVVYGLYFGYTIEDGIVVSRSFADKMMVYDTLHIKEVITTGMLKDAFIHSKGKVKPWDVLMKYRSFGKEKVVRFPSFVEGEVIDIRYNPPKEMMIFPQKADSYEQDSVVVEFIIKVKRPLMVGDKLTGRHGNKGVVSKIVEDNEMPHIKINGQWRPAEIILTPLGVISRKNIGALIETSFSIAKKDGGASVPEGAWVDIADDDIEKVRKTLMKLGSDKWGRFPVKLNNKEFYALAGYQYILRLHHHAETKLSVRKEGPRNIWRQPLGGRKHIGGQRLGEMEVWTLMSHGARNTLEYLLSLRDGIAEDVFFYIMKLLGIHISTKKKGKTQWRFMDEQDYKKMVVHVSDVSEIDERLKLFKVKYKEGYYVSSLLHPYLFKKSVIDRRSFEPKPIMTDTFKLTKGYFNVFLDLIFGKTIHSSKGAFTNKDMWEKFNQKDNVRSEKSSKFGIIRRFILGGRLDMSARAVIVPDPTLPIDEIRIPRQIMDKWGEKEGWVLLGRQPSLHKHSIMAFYGKAWDEMAIAINPMICSGFGADFDGDTMWMVFLGDGGHFSREIEKMKLLNNLSLMRNVEPALLLGHDYAWGYFLKHNAIGEDVKKFIAHDNVDFAIKKNELSSVKKLSSDIKKLLVDRENLNGVLESIKKYLNIATYYPPSFTYFMLREGIDFVYTLPLSGARGGRDAVEELVDKVNVSDKDMTLFGVKSSSSFAKGLDTDLFWAVARRGRNSMMDKKLTVASSGGTTREMVYRLSHIVWKDAKKQIEKICHSSCIARIEKYYINNLSDGYPIGVALGQMLGERATQLAMKTFHTGGKAESGSLLMSFLVYVGKRLKKHGKVFQSDDEIIDYFRDYALPFACEKAGCKYKDIRQYIDMENVEDSIAKLDILEDNVKDSIISKYAFVMKLLSSFDPIWTLMGALLLSDRYKLKGLSALAHRPSAVRNIVKDISNGKVEYMEASEILKWLGVV